LLISVIRTKYDLRKPGKLKRRRTVQRLLLPLRELSAKPLDDLDCLKSILF